FDGDKDGGDENVVHEEDGGNMNDDGGKTMVETKTMVEISMKKEIMGKKIVEI
ncbi:hypothetical protein Tco_1037954, partial [Tanacetum coccineum]